MESEVPSSSSRIEKRPSHIWILWTSQPSRSSSEAALGSVQVSSWYAPIGSRWLPKAEVEDERYSVGYEEEEVWPKPNTDTTATVKDIIVARGELSY